MVKLSAFQSISYTDISIQCHEIDMFDFIIWKYVEF